MARGARGGGHQQLHGNCIPCPRIELHSGCLGAHAIHHRHPNAEGGGHGGGPRHAGNVWMVVPVVDKALRPPAAGKLLGTAPTFGVRARRHPPLAFIATKMRLSGSHTRTTSHLSGSRCTQPKMCMDFISTTAAPNCRRPGRGTDRRPTTRQAGREEEGEQRGGPVRVVACALACMQHDRGGQVRDARLACIQVSRGVSLPS